MSKYTYEIDGVTVDFELQVIRIHNNNALSKFLFKWGHGANTLAKDCKSKYKNIFNTALDITTDSLTVEILGHFYAPQLIRALKIGSVAIPNSLLNILLDLLESIVETKVEIIDCGEKEVDSNREIWDKLAPYRGAIEAVLVD